MNDPLIDIQLKSLNREVQQYKDIERGLHEAMQKALEAPGEEIYIGTYCGEPVYILIHK
jgi:hypothetical protein